MGLKNLENKFCWTNPQEGYIGPLDDKHKLRNNINIITVIVSFPVLSAH
jgi:hypothetical protein